MTIDHAQLKTNLSSQARYLSHWNDGNNRELLRLVNEPRAANEAGNEAVQAAEIQAAVDATEYLALNGSQRALWLAFLTAAIPEGLVLQNSNLAAQVAAIWPQDSTTRSNLRDLRKRRASDIEAWFGEGLIATIDDIRKARRV